MTKSLQAFREWAVAQGSNIGNPTDNKSNKYPGECVSLIQQGLQRIFGIPYAPRGHAKDFVPPNFTSVGTGVALQPGDIVRYPGKYGHIVIIDDEGQRLDQNYKLDGVVRRGGLYSGYTAVFRPALPFQVKTSGGKTVDQVADEVIAGKWGNGVDRQRNLANAGYDFNSVQARVNQKLGAKPAPSPITREYVTIVGDYRSLYRGAGSDKFATLSPNKYGGLTYLVLARSGSYVKISTTSFGEGWIYVGPDVAHLTKFS